MSTFDLLLVLIEFENFSKSLVCVFLVFFFSLLNKNNMIFVDKLCLG